MKLSDFHPVDSMMPVTAGAEHGDGPVSAYLDNPDAYKFVTEEVDVGRPVSKPDR